MALQVIERRKPKRNTRLTVDFFMWLPFPGVCTNLPAILCCRSSPRTIRVRRSDNRIAYPSSQPGWTPRLRVVHSSARSLAYWPPDRNWQALADPNASPCPMALRHGPHLHRRVRRHQTRPRSVWLPSSQALPLHQRSAAWPTSFASVAASTGGCPLGLLLAPSWLGCPYQTWIPSVCDIREICCTAAALPMAKSSVASAGAAGDRPNVKTIDMRERAWASRSLGTCCGRLACCTASVHYQARAERRSRRRCPLQGFWMNLRSALRGCGS